MNKKIKIIFIAVLLAAAVFSLIRYQIGQPIECAFPTEVARQTRTQEAKYKETFWHRVFFTKSECRKMYRDEAIERAQDSMWRPD